MTSGHSGPVPLETPGPRTSDAYQELLGPGKLDPWARPLFLFEVWRHVSTVKFCISFHPYVLSAPLVGACIHISALHMRQGGRPIWGRVRVLFSLEEATIALIGLEVSGALVAC